VTDDARQVGAPRSQKAKAGTETTPDAVAPVAAKSRDGNPFITALVIFTAISGLVAVALYIVGATQNQAGDDPLGQATSFTIAGTFVSFALILFVGTMIAGAINWQLARLKQ
jgi:hypothetical protein